MQVSKIQVKNFRLLHNVELLPEKGTTVVVGRNNSGKTSLTELMRRLLLEKQIMFRFQDFSFCCHKNFWDAFLAFSAGNEDEARMRKVVAIQSLQYRVSLAILGKT